MTGVLDGESGELTETEDLVGAGMYVGLCLPICGIKIIRASPR